MTQLIIATLPWRVIRLNNPKGFYYSCSLLHSVSYFFFFYQSSSSSSLWIVLHSISSNIDEALSVDPSNVFVFVGFHHKDWLTYSGGTDRSGELCYNFFSVIISNDLTQMINFRTRIPNCDSPSQVFLDLFLSFDANISSTMTFPPLGSSDHVVVSVSIDFSTNSKQMPRFIA